MGFTDDVRDALNNRIGRGKRYPNNKRMADDLGVDPSQLNRFLKKERGLNADSLGHILDHIGAHISFEDEPVDATREVCFHSVPGEQHQKPMPQLQPEDYMAVPLINPELGVSAGLIPEDRINGWILVWRHQESLRFRTNLIAMEIPEGHHAMEPALHPGDIVLVDRSDRSPDPGGRIMLIRHPGASGITEIKRVHSRQMEGDTELIYYSDNSRTFPPATYTVQRDYEGDISRAIGGTVVWAWNDMSRK